jgi:putative SOS response-associated peptidase YedK
MCNLYSMTTNQEAIRRLFPIDRDLTGNLPPLPGIFPDQVAPVLRAASDGARELAMLRWGMPCPPQYAGAPVTNIRNAKSPHWRAWLAPAHRCLVPFNAFCEYADTTPRKTPTWFALGSIRPLAFFAGIWTPWHGTRGPKSKPETGRHELFGFLTTNANADVAAIHPQAMPVILTRPEEFETWLAAPPAEALCLQRPLPAGSLQIVAAGEKQDPPQTVPGLGV